MAANPAVVTCTKDTWVKVATNILNGIVYRGSNSPEKYVQTIRLTGQAAPTTMADAAEVFTNGDTAATISSDAAIDVYVMACGAAGSVRVDL